MEKPKRPSAAYNEAITTKEETLERQDTEALVGVIHNIFLL